MSATEQHLIRNATKEEAKIDCCGDRYSCNVDYDESVAKSYVAQMKAWPNFEAALVLIEDGKEVSRERIKM